jgi:RNA polymerase sigma-70 factor (ECF subfamily)
MAYPMLRRSQPVAKGAESLADDATLVEALRAGHPQAPTELFDRYGAHVEAVLANVMGLDPDLGDLLHEVFARALAGIFGLKEGERLKAWLTAIAVFTARSVIRARSQRRWLHFLAPERLPQEAGPAVCDEAREAVRCTYQVLERLPADLRIAFALRYVQGMELSEVAATCDVSLSTVKRRLTLAERRFVKLARRHPALQPWVSEGGRWGAE